MKAKSRSAKQQELRAKLYNKQRGKCHWCGVVCILVRKLNTPKAILATIDHLWDRYHPLRKRGQPGPVVMACWKCNNKRCHEANLIYGQKPKVSNEVSV